MDTNHTQLRAIARKWASDSIDETQAKAELRALGEDGTTSVDDMLVALAGRLCSAAMRQFIDGVRQRKRTK